MTPEEIEKRRGYLWRESLEYEPYGLMTPTALRYGLDFAREVDRLNAEAHSEATWNRVGLARQQFNRLITYPCRLFHSRFPQRSAGRDLQTGRLIWVAFYNSKPSE